MAGLVQSGAATTAVANAAASGGAAAGSSPVMQLLGRGRTVYAAMPPARRRRLIACGVVVALACGLLSWWGGRTEWKTLYAGLDGRDLAQVEGELAAAGIGYQPTADGLGVQVPAELLDKARMEVAAKGMPQSGRMGFELFDKPNWVGSEFDEKVNYQRALEGELEHTIATVGAVRSARVHLVLAKDSLFTAEQQAAKASVVLKLKRPSLSREEIESIRGLVAGAVEGLTPEQVTLVDADGRVNLNAEGKDASVNDQEQALEQKLIAVLEPLAGRENVRATVTVTFDQSSVERTDDVVDPAQTVALQTQKSEQTLGGGAKAGGIPGTVSNTPAAAPQGSAQAAATPGKEPLPVYPTAGAQAQTSHEESSTFAVTRHTTHAAQGPGRVERVTAAVVVNDRETSVVNGKETQTVWKPRTADEMKRLSELAQAAVGFDASRGDQMVLENISFSANSPGAKVAALQRVEEQAQTLLRSQPELLRTIAGAGLAVLLMLLVVRPAAKQAMVLLQEQKALNAQEAKLLTDGERERLQLVDGEGASVEEGLRHKLPKPIAQRRPAAIDREGVLEYVASHIERDPQQSMRLVEAWIGGPANPAAMSARTEAR